MKNIFSVFLFSLCPLLVFCQAEQNKSFKSLESNEVLKRLYDGASVLNSIVTWKPNYSESFSFPVSDDGFCYTNVDTSFLINNGSEQNAIFVFATYAYVAGEKVYGHTAQVKLGFAYFHKTQNGWEIIDFKKDIGYFGSYNEIGNFSIEKIGKSEYCLKYDEKEMGNMGEFVAPTYLYSLQPFHLIFNFAHYITSDALGSKENFTENITMRVMPSTNRFYNIELTYKRNNGTPPKKEIYKYSDDYEEYKIVK